MEVAADPALSHLLPALNRLREPWISAFFNSTKEQHLAQLEHALQNQTLTGTLSLSPTSATFNKGTSSELTFIFAQSFSTGTTTVGFDITHRAAPVNPSDSLGSQRSVSRAVRDDATGIFISVIRLSTQTEIALSRLTPHGRTISLITLTNAAYEDLLGNCVSTSALSPIQTLHSGVISTLYAQDNLSAAPCAKLHPLDFAAEQHNVGCFVAGFESVAQLRKYDCGRLVESDWCSERIGMSVTREGVFAKDMRNWAIQQAVMGCQIRVPGLCVPGSELVGEGEMGGLDMGRVDCSTGRVSEFGADDVVKLLAGLGDTLDASLFDGSALTLTSGSEEQDDPLLKDGLEDIGIWQDARLSNSSNTSVITKAPPHTSVPQDEVNNPPQEGHSSPPQSGSSPAAEYCLPELAPQSSTNSAYVITHISPHISPSRAVPIAPATMKIAARTTMSEAQRKEERRRARNRASAMRSNQKKRLYLKKLREDIAAAGKWEEVLRERERLLREENRELRVTLSQ